MHTKSLNRRTRHRPHRQKMYNMKGCSFFRGKKSKKSNKSNKSNNKSMRGGCGGTCATSHSMIGGYIRQPSSSRKQRRMVKKSESPSSSSTHSHSRTPSSQTGGMTLIPQDVTNFFRSSAHAFGGVYNAAAGYPQPVDPSPTMDQFKSTFNKV
jgi:hypothetical protein